MFNVRLKRRREYKRLTQAELARRVGVGRDSYNRYERAGIQPSIETLVRLAEVLDTSVDYLTCKVSDPNPNLPTDPNDELWELRREMAERSEMKTLFSLAKTADKSTIEFASEMIKRMRKESGYTED
jgi:transcriptional regulator with XRE-family HTH domain